VTLAGVALAAGEGTRLRPLTSLRPKALCPVGNRPLVDLALDRLAPHTGSLAVNAFHLAGQVVEHVAGRAHVSVESGEALGTAGALGALREWIDSRPVLVTNSDSYLPAGLAGFTAGWDGERCRLLCVPASGRGDFVTPEGTPVRYVGACLLPWSAVRGLEPVPTGLYEVLWRDAELDLVVTGAPAVDCGTPADYLAANLHASGGESVIGEGAEVLGTVERSVVWPGARVAPGEHLVEVIRAGPFTVPGSPPSKR
jgi:nucleotidyltransferase-like protein